MYLLDTDTLSPLERGNAESFMLQMRMDQVPAQELATTIVNYEEQMRGWLARAAQANSPEQMLNAYARLQGHIETFAGIPIISFDAKAVSHYMRLQHMRIRIGTMDLKIAAIALANNATLLTRNLADFGKVPDLKTDDWSY